MNPAFGSTGVFFYPDKHSPSIRRIMKAISLKDLSQMGKKRGCYSNTFIEMFTGMGNTFAVNILKQRTNPYHNQLVHVGYYRTIHPHISWLEEPCRRCHVRWHLPYMVSDSDWKRYGKPMFRGFSKDRPHILCWHCSCHIKFTKDHRRAPSEDERFIWPFRVESWLGEEILILEREEKNCREPLDLKPIKKEWDFLHKQIQYLKGK